LEEFGRVFKLYTETCNKETETNEKLLRAMERSDQLEFEVEKLRNELAEIHFLDDL
jgi:hypothetical protein